MVVPSKLKLFCSGLLPFCVVSTCNECLMLINNNHICSLGAVPAMNTGIDFPSLDSFPESETFDSCVSVTLQPECDWLWSEKEMNPFKMILRTMNPFKMTVRKMNTQQTREKSFLYHFIDHKLKFLCFKFHNLSLKTLSVKSQYFVL